MFGQVTVTPQLKPSTHRKEPTIHNVYKENAQVENVH